MKKRIVSLILVVCMGMGMLPLPAVTASAEPEVSVAPDRYFIPGAAGDGQGKTEAIPGEAQKVTGSTEAFSSPWYTVENTVAIENRITVSGDVNLVLKDGCILQAKKGISVPEGASLTIWGQSQNDNMGKLIADGKTYGAGIGGSSGADGEDGRGDVGADGAAGFTGGTITINGGGVAAKAVRAAGIGGGAGGNGGNGSAGSTGFGGNGGAGGNGGGAGTVTINGGIVNASSTDGAGIGGGAGGSGGMGGSGGVSGEGGSGGMGGNGGGIHINGGIVKASSNQGAAVGGGYGGKGSGSQNAADGMGGNGGAIDVGGGVLTAESKTSSGIGGAKGPGSNHNGVPGLFLTTGGNGVIFASSIGNQSGKGSAWSGVIFEGTEGKVYGNPTLNEDVLIPAGYVLSNSGKLTVAAGTALTLEGALACSSGTIINHGTIKGSGTITGTGTFLTDSSSGAGFTAEGIPELLYTGKDLSGSLQNVQLVKKICGMNFTPEGWTHSFQKKGKEGRFEDTASIIDAGTYQITFQNGDGTQNVKNTFTVKKAETAFDSIKCYKNDVPQTEFTYGDTIKVVIYPSLKGTAAASEKTEGLGQLQMALYCGDQQITEAVSDWNGAYTLIYKTTDHKVIPGQQIVARFKGNDNMSDASAALPITLHKKALTASVAEGQSRPYDGTKEFKEAELRLTTDLLEGDTVEAKANGTVENPNADGGAIRPFLASSVALSGPQADFYELPAEDITGEVSITKAVILEARVEITDPKPKTKPVTVTSGTGYAGEISWKGNLREDGSFDYFSQYTAHIKLVPDDNHEFNGKTKFSDLKGQALQNPAIWDNGTAVITKKYENTPNAKILSLEEPDFTQFADYYDNVRDALNALPKTVRITSENGVTELPITWSLSAPYNSNLQANNTFAWKISNLNHLDPGEFPTQGTQQVYNVDAYKVVHVAQSDPITYNGNPIDVKTLFKLDENAGAAEYFVENGTGEGSFIGNQLTVTKAGTFQIMVQTKGNGDYASGKAEFTLQVKPRVTNISIERQTITYGELIVSNTSKVQCLDLLSGHFLRSISLDSENRNATQNGQIRASNAVICSQDGTDVTGCYDVLYQGGELQINRATPQVTAPAGKTDLVYSGAMQTLSGEASTTGGTRLYCLTNSAVDADWSSTVPSGKNAGVYTVWYKIDGGENYYDVPAQSISVRISRRPVHITAQGQTIPYGTVLEGDPRKVTCDLAAGDRITSIVLSPSSTELTDNGTITPSSAKIADGSEDVTDCYEITYHEGPMSIVKAEPQCIRPVGNSLQYSTLSQELVQPGESLHGRFLYRLSTQGEYSTSIPTAVEAGKYDVYYKFEPDGNHLAISETKLPTITIAPKPLKNITVNLDNDTFIYSGQPQRPVVVGVKDGDVEIDSREYSVDYRKNVEASQNGAQVIIKDNPGGNYQLPREFVRNFTILKSQSELRQITLSQQEIVYGDTFTLSFLPSLLEESGFFRRLFTSAPAEATAELWIDGVMIQTIRGITEDKLGTFRVSTADKKIPASSFDGRAHSFTIKWGGDKNLKEATGEISAVLRQLPLKAALSVKDSKVYDGTYAFTNIALEFSNAVRGDKVSGIASGTLAGKTVTGEGWDARVETAVLDGEDKDFYSLVLEDVSGSCRITPKEVKLQWSNLSQNYTGKPVLPTAEVTNAVAGDVVEVTVVAVGEATQAGKRLAMASKLSNENYKLPLKNTAEYTIKQVAPEFKAPAAETLIYNGYAQNLLTDENRGTTAHGEIHYAASQTGHYSLAIPQGKNAQEYTIWYKVVGDENHMDSAPGSLTVKIAPKNIEDAEINLGRTLIYNGREQTQTVDTVTVDNLQATFDVVRNKGTDAKIYTLTVEGNGNFTGTAKKEFVIEKAPLTVVPNPNQSKIYGSKDPEFTYTAKLFGKDKLSGKLERAEGTAVGQYAYGIGSLNNDNYQILLDDSYGFTILPKTITAKITIADKQYNGLSNAVIASAILEGVVGKDDVQLVNGTATFDSEQIGKDIPVSFTTFSLTGADAGNYLLLQPTGVTGNIVSEFHPASGTEFTLSGEGWLCEDLVVTAAEGYMLSLHNSASGNWSTTLTGSDVGKDSELVFYVRDEETGGISDQVVVAYQLDKTAPTGFVTIDGLTKWQEFLNKISFDTFYQNSQRLVVEAEDELSGVADIAAVLVNRPLTLGQVLALQEDQWASIDSETIIPAVNAEQFVYYVRITDEAGNHTYLSTDGAEFDTQAPEILGLQNGKTYYTTQKVLVKDKNLKSVQLNSWTQSFEFFLPAVEQTTQYAIAAEDKAGNVTKVTVVMEPLSSVPMPPASLTPDNVTLDQKQVMEEYVRNLTELLDNPYLTDQEKMILMEGKNRADALLNRILLAEAAIRTDAIVKTETITLESVKMEDKAQLAQAKADYEAALLAYPNNYTEEQQQKIQTELARLVKAIESIANAQRVIDEILKLPPAVEPDDDVNEARIKTAQQSFDALTDHEKEMAGENGGQLLQKLQADLVNYKIIHGDGSSVVPGSDNELLIIANGNMKKFVALYVDEKLVSPDQYSVMSGSTIVTLSSGFLQSLALGEHGVRFEYSDGETSGTFTAGSPAEEEQDSAKPENPPATEKPGEETKPGQNGKPVTPNKPDGNGSGSGNGSGNGSGEGTGDAPQTGDEFLPAIWLGMLLVTAAAGLVLVRKKRSIR